MKSIKIGLSLLFVLIFLLGCGTTNYLQWAKSSDDNRSDVELARTYLDDGEYSKAKKLVQDDKSDEAQIIYAECLMGESGVDLAGIIKALTDDKVSANPVMRLESLINNASDRAKIIQAADIFAAHIPKKSSDKIIGALCNMTAHAGNLKNAFNGASFNSLRSIPDTDDATVTYNALGANPILYMNNSVMLLGSLVEENTVRTAIVSMNAEIVSINNYVKAHPSDPIPWVGMKPLLGF
jgi:hypothetical protein